MTATLRATLPTPIPPPITRLPVARGYPVPWFVAKVDGVYDFRIIKPGAVMRAFTHHLCWICGETLGPWVTFVAGPMCAVNRNSAEPPSHRECAEWSAIACPFLTRPHMVRRDNDIPEAAHETDGLMLRRNPGVAMCWHTTRSRFKKRAGLQLFDIGNPYDVTWYAEGRTATREEVLASFESGLPALQELADAQGKAAQKRLVKLTTRAMRYVPAA